MEKYNLKKISLSESMGISSPHPYALLVSKIEDTVNIMGVSWFSFVSLKPGMIAFSINNKSYTKELINKGASINLCLPTEKIKEKAYACGTITGRGIDKAQLLAIDYVDIEGFSAPVVTNAAVAWKLEICSSVAVSDHTLYIAEVKEIVGDSTQSHIYAFDGYKRVERVYEHST